MVPTHARRQRGFTLIEILIVVVILGILAAIVIPQFTNASQEAQVSAVKSQLQTVRSQIELFRVKNGSGALPATGDDAGLFDLLTTPDDLNDGFQYLQSIPKLPNDFWDWDWDGVTLKVTYDAANGPVLPGDVAPEDW